ncbi:MAG: VOC family protein [Vicinamibacteria bacterium]|nr:VOC family protein [Vicinamibacteria bacterium]
MTEGIAGRREAGAALDHLLIGAPTLENGIAWLEEKTGVRAAIGGSHPGLGTWNALASLGFRQYLEIIAPDPGQPGVQTIYVPGLRSFDRPRITTWAAVGRDLNTHFGAALPKTFSCEPPRPGTRIRPDGKRLAWSLAFPKLLGHGTLDGALPFFIEWQSNDMHPGQITPKGLTLKAFSIEHPKPKLVLQGLRALGLECAVHRATVMSIRVEVETPRGTVFL